MNIFINAIQSGQISTETDLKHLFWKLAKKLHPDIASLASNHSHFIKLKADFDEAIKLIVHQPPIPPPGTATPDFAQCMALFTDLIASNFPIDKSIRLKNKYYIDRLNQFNKAIRLYGSEYFDLIFRVEEELDALRGPTVVSNHPFGLVKLYFYRLSDYFYSKTALGFRYVFGSRDMLFETLQSKGCHNTIKLISWFLDTLRK